MTEHYLDRLARTINENWDQPALTDYYLTEDGVAQDISRGKQYTYGEMYTEIIRVSTFLKSIGLQKGDHIAICGSNSANWVIAYWAIAHMQGIAVTLMHSVMVNEITNMVNFSDAKALFVDTLIWNALKDIPLPQVREVIALDDWSALLGCQMDAIKVDVSDKDCCFPKVKSDDLAMISFTSGSTGRPKGVMLAHRVHSMGGESLQSLFPSPRHGSHVMTILPFGHIFGLADVNSALYSQCHVYILRQTIHPSLLLSVITRIQPYRIMLIPMLMDALIAIDKNGIMAEWSVFLKYAILGGASLPSQTIESLHDRNFPLTVGYGTTESAPMISISSVTDFKPGSCGKILANTLVCIADNGEILVKGENVMLGYYKDPEATVRKIDFDGWLHTGDKGHLDEDGYLYVEGRLEQDMIVLPNGENIHPEDIEYKINALPEVKESIVLARDGKLVAIVVPQITNDQSPMTNTDLRRIILRNVNPQLPLFSQLYDVEITDTPLHKTEKQTIKRYLYK